MALRQLSKIEQRYRAVLAVEAGDRVNEVAHRLGVSRRVGSLDRQLAALLWY